METSPMPIVICTATSDPSELAVAFRSLEAGAVACVGKPTALGPDFAVRRDHLLQTVRLMSEVKVVRRWNRRATLPHPWERMKPKPTAPAVQLIGIGASTGGPPVSADDPVEPAGLPVPLLIVQHIARGFLPGMVEWLSQTTALRVHIAAHGVAPLSGHVYVAPDDFHLAIDSRGHLLLSRAAPENGLRPAVSFLFRSLATVFGAAAVGVLLTGMGQDGAIELKQMKGSGAHTIAQDRDSSVVHGMPGHAIELGGATQVLPADRIASALLAQVERVREISR